jgi:serine/threonine-protein phosphatase PGAM5
LYLVRHGQYRAMQGPGDIECLTALGRRQAARLGKRLQGVTFAAVYHSDAPRAVETADILLRHLPPVSRRSVRLLREGIPFVAAHFAAPFRPPRADVLATRERMDRAFTRFVRTSRSDRKELIVAHGNIIRYLIRCALGDGINKWWQLDTLQCSLSILRISSERVTFAALNDVGHLPPGMQTHM